MNNTTITAQDEQIKYSKVLSSLFCSVSIVTLSILSLLNTLSIDIYSTVILLKIVLPASFCFWFIGFVIGKILDGFNTKIIKEKIIDEEKAYEIPSMFAASNDTTDDEFGLL